MYYQEITITPMVDIHPYHVWSQLYHILHLALVENKQTNDEQPIGISFPDYQMDGKNNQLGLTLRLCSHDPNEIKKLAMPVKCQSLGDYLNISDVMPIPDKVTHYASFSRVQYKTSSPRLARRYAKRHGISYEEALNRYSQFDEQVSQLPFIRIKSATTQQNFCLFIKRERKESQEKGLFNCYGLSDKSTVPLF